MDQKLSQNPEADIEMEPVVEKRRGMVRRFWSSDEAQEEWKAYLGEIEEGSSTQLYFATLIFVSQSQAYIEKLKEKQAKEAKKAEKKNGGSELEEEKKQGGRKKNKGFYKEESESDSDMSVDEDSQEKRNKAGKSSRARRAN